MRADVYLYTKGLTQSRQNAKILIEGGNVLLNGKVINKPSFEIDENTEHNVDILNKQRFVSRGGEKLDFALQNFGVDVNDLDCIDVGASTGGFTDCLLQRGAKLIYAVDSGHSQLDKAIEENERVVSIEKYNARFMQRDDFPCQFDIAVMDVSFISQTLIHQGIHHVLKDDGILISLIKPQFECGKSALNSQGIVKNTVHHHRALYKVIDNALLIGFSCVDIIRSPIEGGSGNTEFLALFKKSTNPTNYISESKLKHISKSI